MRTIMAVGRSRDDRQPGLFVPKPSNSAGCRGRPVRAARGAPASPSRGARAGRGAAARLTWEALSGDVRWCASLPAVIVTNFVTRSLGDTRNGGGLATLRRLPWARSTFAVPPSKMCDWGGLNEKDLCQGAGGVGGPPLGVEVAPSGVPAGGAAGDDDDDGRDRRVAGEDGLARRFP